MVTGDPTIFPNTEEYSVNISVVIAAYNAAPFIMRAIQSVRSQTQEGVEIIVVDDASIDETRRIVTEAMVGFDRERLLFAPRNSGPGAARNLGLDAASGEWIAILDADDAMIPQRLKTMYAYAVTRDLDLVADNQFLFDAQANAVSRTAFSEDDPVRDWTLLTHFQNDDPLGPFQYGLSKPL